MPGISRVTVVFSLVFLLVSLSLSAQEVVLQSSARTSSLDPEFAINSNSGDVMVVWTQDYGSMNLKARYAFLEYGNGNYTLKDTGDIDTSHFVSGGPDVVYNPHDDEFMAVYYQRQGCFQGELWSQRFDSSGNKISGPVLVTSRQGYSPGSPQVLCRQDGEQRYKYLLFWNEINHNGSTPTSEINRAYLHTSGQLTGTISVSYAVPYSYNGPWYGFFSMSRVCQVEGDEVIVALSEFLPSQVFAVKVLRIDDNGNLAGSHTFETLQDTDVNMAAIRPGRNYMLAWYRPAEGGGKNIFNLPIRPDFSISGTGRYPSDPYKTPYGGLGTLASERALGVYTIGSNTLVKIFDARGSILEENMYAGPPASFLGFPRVKEIPGESKVAVVYLKHNQYNNQCAAITVVDFP